MSKPLPIVEVLWLDAHSVDGWHRKPKHKLKPVRSVGMLVKQTKRAVVLAASHHADTDEPFSSAVTIPRCAVTKMRKVKS